VSAGNAGDASVAEQLIGDLLENDEVTVTTLSAKAKASLARSA